MAAVTQAPAIPPAPAPPAPTATATAGSSVPRPSSSASNTQPGSPAAKPEDNSALKPATNDQPAETVATVTVKEPTPEFDSDNSKDSRSQDESPAEPAESGQPHRPPPRPNAQGGRSRFEQEPNPFEQSFSYPPSKGADDHTPPRGTDATSTRHALPPLSSLTSPAATDPSQFPWLANSLRSGPLSPAMLTGPAGQNPSTRPESQAGGEGPTGPFEGGFRTGFTPGTGSGFTPSYGSFINPNLIPSPNTAAFLNSITNVTPLGEGSEVASAAQAASASGPAASSSGPGPASAIPPHMQPHAHPSHPPMHPPMHPHAHPHHVGHANSHAQNNGHQATITPNTLNALTGVFGDMSRAPSSAPGGPGGPGGGPGQGQPGFFAPAMASGAPGQGHMPVPVGHPGYVDFAQHNANAASQAANGLFLLSQAHQELSKREEAESTPPSSASASRRTPKTSAPPPDSTSGAKRKADSVSGGGAGGKGKKGKKAKKVETSEDSDDGSIGDMSGIGLNGKPETEEEKRKNFLERNRQAALKCRQRKKAWLQELQSKTETLTMENERLSHTVQTMHEEVTRLTAILMQHRDCGLGVPAGNGYGRVVR